MYISCMVVQSSFHCYLSDFKTVKNTEYHIPSVSKRTKRSSGSHPKL
ncbi:unnamed protein product [Brassica napus]|uniref:(rape) hypothetical protein n=1 Tax=Brassica napus TaxID=3708 RepID=A0A816V3Z6_BRANA|nr:unnamed protein product [Brassica napus]